MTAQVLITRDEQREANAYKPWQPTLGRQLQLSLGLQRFAYKYFAQLDVEYESLCTPEYKKQALKEVAALRQANIEAPSWATNHRFEFVLLDGLPFEILKQRSLVHRNRLLALVGDEAKPSTAEAFPAPLPDWTLEKLKQQASGVLMEVQRFRHLQSEFNKLRNRLLIVSVLPGLSFVVLALFYAKKFPGFPLVESVAVFGLLGGYLSVLLRLGSLSWAPKYAANYQQVDRLFWNLLLNFILGMVQGGLGAVILYFVFCSGALSAPIFPNLIKKADGKDLVGEGQILLMSAVGHQVFAQLMLWSTIAGFSERLVPDLLSGLSKEVTALPKKPDA